MVLTALTLPALALRLYGLARPHSLVFDEIYFAKYAHAYITGAHFFDVEPPLGPMMISLGERVFGFNSVGWRIVPALCGTAVIPLLFLLAKRLFGGTVLPAIAGALGLLEGLYLVDSRIALLEILVVFLELLTLVLFLYAIQAKSRVRSTALIAATGLSLGLAVSVKWVSLAMLAPMLMILFVLVAARWPRARRLLRAPERESVFGALGIESGRLLNPVVFMLALGLLPAAVYVGIFALHMPFDSYTHNLVKVHRSIWNFHAHLHAHHPYASRWWSWPELKRPVSYYFGRVPHASGPVSGGKDYVPITALGNPAIWWSGALALLYGLYEVVVRRRLVVAVVLMGYLATWLPWALVPRIQYSYYYAEPLAFLLLALAYAVWRVWEARPPRWIYLAANFALLTAAGVIGALLGRSFLAGATPLVGGGLGAAAVVLPLLYALTADARWLSRGRKLALLALVVPVLIFVFFHPIWTGGKMLPSDWMRHLWMRSWL